MELGLRSFVPFSEARINRLRRDTPLSIDLCSVKPVIPKQGVHLFKTDSELLCGFPNADGIFGFHVKPSRQKKNSVVV